jgi:hypothetical protein
MHPVSGGLHEPTSRAYVAGPVIAEGRHVTANGSRAKLRAAQRVSAHRMSRQSGRESHRGKLHITNGAYDPTDIYSSEAYNYNALYNQGHCCNPLGNPGSSPVQDSIAIATFGSQNGSDFTGFHNQYSYLAADIQEVNIDGSPPCCDGEGTMDAEWSTAMSNSFGGFGDTAKVYLYDGASNTDATWTDIYNTMVSQNRFVHPDRHHHNRIRWAKPGPRAHLPVRGHRDRQRQQHQRREGGQRLHPVAAPGKLHQGHVLHRLEAAGAHRRQRRIGRLRHRGGQDRDPVVHRRPGRVGVHPGLHPRLGLGQARLRRSGDHQHARHLTQDRADR